MLHPMADVTKTQGSISLMKVSMLEWEGPLDLGDEDGACVFLPYEDPSPTPDTSGGKQNPWEEKWLGQSYSTGRVDDHIEDLSLWRLQILPTSSPDAPPPPTTDLNNPNMSDLGSDTPLTKSWNEEEANEEADLRTWKPTQACSSWKESLDSVRENSQLFLCSQHQGEGRIKGWPCSSCLWMEPPLLHSQPFPTTKLHQVLAYSKHQMWEW